jgi:hypothetical protein
MRELNWKPEQSAELTVLGERAAAGSGGYPVRIIEFAGRRMRLAAQSKVEGGAAVRLEWDGQMVLGEVLHAEPGGFWMKIHHMLPDTAGLSWRKTGWQRG